MLLRDIFAQMPRKIEEKKRKKKLTMEFPSTHHNKWLEIFMARNPQPTEQKKRRKLFDKFPNVNFQPVKSKDRELQNYLPAECNPNGIYIRSARHQRRRPT
jgi:hypothetical protein